MLEADNYNIESTINEIEEADFSDEVYFSFIHFFFHFLENSNDKIKEENLVRKKKSKTKGVGVK